METSVHQIMRKRYREDPDIFHLHMADHYQDDQILEKRQCPQFLSEFLRTEDGDCLDGVPDDFAVLHMMKNLQEEISRTSEILSTSGGYNNHIDRKTGTSIDKECAGEVGESVTSCKYRGE